MKARSHRRRFLQATSLAGVGFWVGGSSTVARTGSANERLNIACIGIGNRGAANVRGVSDENIVALCDVDERLGGPMWVAHPRAKRYADFRKMLDEMHHKIDAVVVSTPDHTHAPASLMAMRLGKHVYCEKPLAHNVYECRLVTETARKEKVITQLGTQLHATFQVHRARELIQAGVIGQVKEVHCSTDLRVSDILFPKPWESAVTNQSGRPWERPPVPRWLHWDLWLGPALDRPYHPAYCPAGWRFWRDFGTGGLGDMGCHIMDPAFFALGLKYPISIEAVGPPVPYEKLPAHRPGISVRYVFAGDGDQPDITLYWHGAGSGPPAELLDGKRGTCLFVGQKGQLLCHHHPLHGNEEPQLLPEAHFKDVKLPETRLERLRSPRRLPGRFGFPGRFGQRHHREWLDGCRTGTIPDCHFPTFGGPLAESVLLGHVAFWAGQKLRWDGEKMAIPNCPEAEKYLRRKYRKDWEL